MNSFKVDASRLLILAGACFLVAVLAGSSCNDVDQPNVLLKSGTALIRGGKVPFQTWDMWIRDVTSTGGHYETKTFSPILGRNDGLAGGVKGAATSTGGGAPNAQSKFLPNAALFAGGIGKSPDFTFSSPQAYFYDFAKDEWTGLEMNSPRRLHTLTTLLDGSVLVAGGWDGKRVPNTNNGGESEPAVSSTELFDPTTQTFRPGGPLLAARRGHAAARLADGRVLFVGGGTGSTETSDDLVRTAEIYDPATDSFSATGSTLVDFDTPLATTLDDGRVLVIGDSTKTNAEAYDPATGIFSPIGNMTAVHGFGATATKLKDGRVLILGGAGASAFRPTAIAEVFDPIANTFTAIEPMRIQRANHVAVLQSDGTVLVAGGNNFENNEFQETAYADLFDPATNTFSPLPDMPEFSSSGAGVYLER